MVARVSLAVVAVVVIGWVGVLLRNLEVGQDAAIRSFFAPRLGAAERADDRRRLEDASLLDPSSYWKLAHASNLLRSGDDGRAVAEAERLVRDEPENAAAWSLLRSATSGRDPARAAEAAERLRQLNPLGSR